MIAIVQVLILVEILMAEMAAAAAVLAEEAMAVVPVVLMDMAEAEGEAI